MQWPPFAMLCRMCVIMCCAACALSYSCCMSSWPLPFCDMLCSCVHVCVCVPCRLLSTIPSTTLYYQTPYKLSLITRTTLHSTWMRRPRCVYDTHTHTHTHAHIPCPSAHVPWPATQGIDKKHNQISDHKDRQAHTHVLVSLVQPSGQEQNELV